jgi:hypothetical protein
MELRAMDAGIQSIATTAVLITAIGGYEIIKGSTGDEDSNSMRVSTRVFLSEIPNKS